MPLAPFGKEPLELTLNGITDGTSDVDPSCDYLSASFLPLYIKFGVGADDALPPPSIRVEKRGAAPLGCGRAHFYCPIVKELTPIELVEFGKVKRVRGNAISCRIPPSSAARVAHSAKGVMHRLLPDVWIHTDAHSSSGKRNKDGSPGGGCGPSPGLSVILTATTTEGVCLSAECSMSHNVESNRGVLQQNLHLERKKMELPEDLGKRSATMLLHEIFCGGCIDTSAQTFALLMMCLTPEDVSRIRLGSLSSYTVVSLRLLKEAFGVEFKLRVDEEVLGDGGSDEEEETGMKSSTVLCSCLGIGYRNMARAST
jgi:RNA 3'-terminal phosphate cyclase-like protein